MTLMVVGEICNCKSRLCSRTRFQSVSSSCSIRLRRRDPCNTFGRSLGRDLVRFHVSTCHNSSSLRSAILSSIFLKERLTLFGKVGCFLCMCVDRSSRNILSFRPVSAQPLSR